MKQEQKDEAKAALLQALAQDEASVEVLTLLCELENTKEGYKAAIGYGERAVAAGPENGEAHYRYALALSSKLQFGNMFSGYAAAEKFRAEIKKAIELDPKNLDAHEYQIMFYRRSVAQLGGDPEKALELAKALAEIDEHRGLIQMVQVYQKLERSEPLIGCYERLLKFEPDSFQYITGLGLAYQNQQRYHEADALFAKIEPNAGEGYYHALYQRGRTRIFGNYELEAAIGFLKDYAENAPQTEMLPRSSSAWWRIGVAYEQLDDIDQARKSYERAISINPREEPAIKALEKLNQAHPAN